MIERLEADNSADTANTRARGGWYSANKNVHFTASAPNNGINKKRKDEDLRTGFRIVSLYPIAPKPEGLTNHRPSWIAAQWSLGEAVLGLPVSKSLSEHAIDPDGNATDLVFSILSGPDWLSIDGNQQLTGTPTSADLGIHELFRVLRKNGRLGS